MGIIGTGRIGKIAIKIAKGFGMNVIAYDPFPDENYAKEAGYSYVSLEDLLKIPMLFLFMFRIQKKHII